MGRDVSEDMCKLNSRGKEKEKVKQQATGDGFGRAHGQNGDR